MKYPSDIDYDRDQEPTPLQEMRQNWHDEVAALKEQIVEAVRLLKRLQMPQAVNFPLQNDIAAFLDQNADIAKEVTKESIPHADR